MNRLISIIVGVLLSISALCQEMTLKNISEAGQRDLSSFSRYRVTAYFVETIDIESLVFTIEDDGYIIPVRLQKNDLNATNRFLARNLKKGDFLSVVGQIDEIEVDKQKYRGLIDAVIVENDEYEVKGQGSAAIQLKGRTLLGSLPKPSYVSQTEGVVVVQIMVDEYGAVVEAVPGAEGTTISDKAMWKAARSAALKTHFNQSAKAPVLQTGTITYTFKLK